MMPSVEEYRLRAFEKRMLKRIQESKLKTVTVNGEDCTDGSL
jgi:hypothetical protein